MGRMSRRERNKAVGQRKGEKEKARKKKVYWQTTYGKIDITIQRFLDDKKLRNPFLESVHIRNRGYSLDLQRKITDFGADIPFGQVSEKLKEHYGIEISTSAIQEITKNHAKSFKQMLERDEEKPSKTAKCIIGEMDGTMIPLVSIESVDSDIDKRKKRKTFWKEARLSFCREKDSISRITLATMGSTDIAGEQLMRCAKKVGLGEETEVHCLGDGAIWIREQVEKQFGTQATYTVDFYHLSEYLAKAGSSCSNKPKKWLHQQQQRMKTGCLKEVLRDLQKHLEGGPKKEKPANSCYQYIKKRKGQFEYKRAIESNLPIGSGEIESSHKSIIHKRLKIPGAWWKKETAENMLALRCARANGQWRKYWEQIEDNFKDVA